MEPKVHYSIHKSPSLVPILGQMNPVYNFPPRLSLIFLLSFSEQNFLPCVLYAPPISFAHRNIIWYSVRVVKFPIMQSSPVSYHFLPSVSKFSPQQLVFKHLQSMFLPQCKRPSFTPIQNNRQNYRLIYFNL